MGLIVLTFAAIFLLIASVGLLMFYREAMLARISAVINPDAKEKKSLLGSIQQTGVSLGGIVERLEGVLPKSKAEVSVVQQRLIRAGYRSESAIKVFYGVKILVPRDLLSSGCCCTQQQFLPLHCGPGTRISPP